MKTEQPFLSKSQEYFKFEETDCLKKYQLALVDEMDNPIHDIKQRRFFMAEIQRIEKFVKTVQKYA